MFINLVKSAIIVLAVLPFSLFSQKYNSVMLPNGINYSTLKASSSCENDTLQYTVSKATAIEYQGVSAPDLYVKIAQRFEVPQEITVYGACFYGYTSIFGSTPAAINVDMYNLDSVGLPDTIIATQSTTVPIGTGTPFSSSKRCVSWPSPVTVNEAFFISIDGSGTSEPLGIGRNSFTNSDGQNEALSAVYYDDLSGASHVKWYNQTTDPVFATTPWDYDYLIEPIVSYELITNMTVSADTACSGTMICVETDSISPIFYSSMYNTNPSVIPVTNWGNGNTTNGDSTCTFYNVAGNYLIDYSVTIDGWRVNCIANQIDSIEIEAPVASFSYTIMEDTVLFTNTSTGASVVSWTFDTFGTSAAFDTTFVFPNNGTFIIQQITTSAFGCIDSVTQTVNITVGTNEVAVIKSPKLYPNPNSGGFRVEFKSKQDAVNLTIATIEGLLVQSIQHKNINVIDVDFQGRAGIYIVTVNTKTLKSSFPVIIQ